MKKILFLALIITALSCSKKDQISNSGFIQDGYDPLAPQELVATKTVDQLPAKTSLPALTWLGMWGNPVGGKLYKMTAQHFIDSVIVPNWSGSGGGTWGSITGTLSSQTDLQTALNLKANLAGPTFTGTVVLPSTTSIGSVSSTEIGHVNGVTSNIQDQIDGIVAGSLPSIPDLSTFINVSGGSAAPTAGHYSVFNVLDFGMVGDSSTDNTAAFRALLAILPDGSSVHIPKGDYVFTDTIVIDKNINIYGDGHSSYSFFTFTGKRDKGATNLYYTSGTKDFLIFKTSVTNNNPIASVHDLSIINTATGGHPSGAGVKMVGNVLGHVFERVTIKKFNTNIKAYSASFLSINDCDIVAPYKYGIDLGNVAEPDCGVYNVFNCRIISGLHNSGDSTIGIIYRGSGEAKITHCDFNAQGVFDRPTQFLYQFYSTFELGQTSIVNITNNFFENYQRTAIYMTNVVALPIYSIKIVGNSISPFNNVGGQAFNAIKMVGPFRDVTIMDNGGHSLFSTPTITDYAFLRVDSVEQLKVYPGSQDGWAVYDSITNSLDNQTVLMTPMIYDNNSSKGLIIDNRSAGASSNANIELKADGNSAFLYQTSDAYGFGLDNSLVVQTPTGDLSVYGAQENLRVNNNGTVFMPDIATGAGDRELRWSTTTGEITYTTIASGGGDISGSIADNQIAFGTAANTIGGSANFTYDGTTLAYSGLGNDMMTLTGTGTAGQGNTFHLKHTNAEAGIAFLMENDRGSFASYGSNLYGGSTSAGTLFGMSWQDRYIIYTGGASNLGMILGNYNSQPIYVGTNNLVRMTVEGDGDIGIGASSPNASAILDVQSTTKGLLLPRMTKAQRDAISSPVAGLSVYQTDNTPGLRVFNGTNWMRYTETAD